MVDLRACPVIPFIWAKPFYPGGFIHRFKGKTLTSERMQHKKKKRGWRPWVDRGMGKMESFQLSVWLKGDADCH